MQLKQGLGEVNTVEGAEQVPLIWAVEAGAPNVVKFVPQGIDKLLDVGLLNLLQSFYFFLQVSYN